jgi:hypothetical protein
MIKRLRIEIVLSIFTLFFLGLGTALSLLGIFEIGIASIGVAVLGASHLLMISREQIDALMFKYFVKSGCDECGSKKHSEETPPVICYSNGLHFTRFIDIRILCWECFQKKCPHE